ncbi:TPA: restriction endonuclease subunit S [Providencia rettgeri]|uniref:methylation-associated defense system restriction endonuclease subunit S MAD5 n=1 Tax=Providencia sp. PROV209 TaxID=2949906 RepID=UPI00234B8E73|nr:restriction endonuclease subunit S [Providencia sp. PROV209]
MKVSKLKSSWIYEHSHRLDSSPYMTGAIESKDMLKSCGLNMSLVKDITSSIYKGKMLKRTFVHDKNFGTKFLTTTGMQRLDSKYVPLLANSLARMDKGCFVKPGMTLISAAGTIGNLAYVRKDMEGDFACGDILKITAKDIPSGYLYAFFKSRFGIPLVIQGTYGSIVQHLDGKQLENISIPRLNEKIEIEIHEHIENAANSRAEANDLISKAINIYEAEVGTVNGEKVTSFSTGVVSSKALVRLDAQYYSEPAINAEIKHQQFDSRKLSDVSDVFTPGIFKRPYVDEAKYGYPYYSGTEVFLTTPTPRGYLNKKAPNIQNYVVQKDWLLIQDAGQLGGLIGQVMRVSDVLDKSVVSNHLMRIKPDSKEIGAYLFAALSSETGYTSIVRNAFGSSIPQLDPKHIAKISIPWLPADEFNKIVDLVSAAWDLQDFARHSEEIAVNKIESTIFKYASN